MICKNCTTEYDDSLEACPGCGAQNVTDQSLPEEKEVETCAEGETSAAETTEEETAETAAENQAVEDDEQVETTDENGSADEKQDETEETKPEEKPEVKVKKAPQPRKVMSPAQKKAKKAEKTATALIITIMCIVAALAVALTVLSLTTDTFEGDDSSEKVVAGVGLTAQEEKDLEVFLAKSFTVARSGFNKSGLTAEEFLSYINPADSGNIYSRLNEVKEPLQTEADPAGRFADENGTYAYYKLEESRVDKVLELFALKSYRGENCKEYYYCDGFYYFADKKTNDTPEVNAKIVKSRRVLDGSYYVEGYYYIDKQGETVKTDNCHFVVEIIRNDQTDERSFILEKVSKEPIFGSDGKLVNSSNNTEKKTEVIEGFTDDGKLVCVYNLEYPVVEGELQAYKNANDFFANAISVYQLKAKDAQKLYTDYIHNGGDEGKLPFVENVVAEVVFEDDRCISLVSKISRYSPSAGVTEEETEGFADGIYKRTVEAYAFDKASGDFVSKDDALGKNYLLIGEILYRIYNGYDYESILPTENEEDEEEPYDETPSDTEGTGAKIYESAWSYTDEGVTFYYLTDKGYVTEITIPADVVKKIK